MFSFKKINPLFSLFAIIIFLFPACGEKTLQSKEERLVFDFEKALSQVSVYEDTHPVDFDAYIAVITQVYDSLKKQSYSDENILLFIDSNFSYLYSQNENTTQVLGRELLGEIQDKESKENGYQWVITEFEKLKDTSPLASGTDSHKIIICKKQIFSEDYQEVVVLRYSTYGENQELVRSISYIFDSGTLKISSAGVRYEGLDSIDQIPKERIQQGFTILP